MTRIVQGRLYILYWGDHTCHFSWTRPCQDLFWLCFPVFILAEGNDRKVVWTITCRHCTKRRCEKVGSTVKAMLIRVHIMCVRLKAPWLRPICVWHQSTSRAFWKHKEPSVWYFDVIHWLVANKAKTYIFSFRQYRNPGQDASGKNGAYGHPKFIYVYIQQSDVFICVKVEINSLLRD